MAEPAHMNILRPNYCTLSAIPPGTSSAVRPFATCDLSANKKFDAEIATNIFRAAKVGAEAAALAALRSSSCKTHAVEYNSLASINELTDSMKSDLCLCVCPVHGSVWRSTGVNR